MNSEDQEFLSDSGQRLMSQESSWPGSPEEKRPETCSGVENGGWPQRGRPTAEGGCLGSGLGTAFVDHDVPTPYLKTFFY